MIKIHYTLTMSHLMYYFCPEFKNDEILLI